MEVKSKRRRLNQRDGGLSTSAAAAAAVSEPAQRTDQALPASSAEVEGKKPARPVDIPIARGDNADAVATAVSPSPTGANGKKKRRRRKRKAGDHHQGGRSGSGGNKWKPYDKLTWEERRALEEKETRRATTRREERIASGQPMAPYNTTQFLMDQHDPACDPAATVLPSDAVPQKRNDHRKSSGSVSELDDETTDDDPNSDRAADDAMNSCYGNDEEIFLQKDFADAYESFRAERLQTLSKDELVREYLDMEAKLEGVYSRLEGMNLPGVGSESVKVQIGTGQDPLMSLLEELNRLRAENTRLLTENEQLKTVQH